MKKIILPMVFAGIFVVVIVVIILAAATKTSNASSSSNTLNNINSANISTTTAISVTADSTSTPVTAGKYKDGTYTGQDVSNDYGDVQVSVKISNSKIVDVQFLNIPTDASRSRMINDQAGPMLRQEAITSQNSNVDIISGATSTSMSFNQSLSSALSQAV